MVWPSSGPATLTVHTGDSQLTLPVREPDAADNALPPFAAPQAATPSSAQTPLKPPRLVRSIERDLLGNEVVYRVVSEGGDLEAGAMARIEAIDLELGHTVVRQFSIRDADPLSARAEMNERLMLRRGDWRVRVQASTEMTASNAHFRIRARLQAHLGEDVFYDRDWDEWIPRELV